VALITIYSKPGCHLCELAKEVVERCRQKADFAVEIIDISQNPELLERYRDSIPVILLDGNEVARHFVRERKLLELLR
jgi:glutaredoxin